MQNDAGRLRAMVISAAMAAMALVLPVAFHAVGLGNKFLPMLLPLLLNGFFVPVGWAAATGALVPLLSSLATGMPPLYPPVAAAMSLEGAVLGGVSAAVYRGRAGRLWFALVAAVLLGRAASFGANWTLAQWFGLPPRLTAAAALLQGLPGVLLQFAVAPLVVRQAARRGGILFNHDTR